MNKKRAQLLMLIFFWIYWPTWLFYLGFMDIKRNKKLYKDTMGVAWYGGYPFLALGLALDTLFNWTFGTVFFREFPREFLFTARCSRHLKSDNEIQKQRAEFACKNLLDPADKGHCE